MRAFIQPALLLALPGFLAACGPWPAEEATPTPGHEEEVHWSYDGDTGPEHWGELSEEWALCSEGARQSPIDLDASEPLVELPDLAFAYGPSQVSMLNNGHALQYVYDAGSTLTIDGVAYTLLQFHFHAKSEHTVDGMAWPAELHLVHQAADGSLAVVGLLIEEGEESATLQHAELAQAPTAAQGTYESETTYNVADLLPGGSSWRYEGSLTTPPCSEGVAWHVMEAPITLSASQIGLLTSLYDHNYRPVQAVGDRDPLAGE